MITVLINLLVLFLVLAVFYWIAQAAASHFGAPPIIIQIIGVIFLLLFLLAVLQAIGVVEHGGWWRFRP